MWRKINYHSSQKQNRNEPFNAKGSANQPTLAHQGSFSILTPLCKKTLDEVWFEIQKDLPQHRKANVISDRCERQSQRTFGEMTLEDFLVKAGIVQELWPSSQQKKSIPQNNNPSSDANFGMGHVMPSSHQNMNSAAPLQNGNMNMDASLGMGSILGMGFQGNNFATNSYAATCQVFPQSKIFFEESSSNVENGNRARCLLESGAMENKKRIINGPLEVVVERRQRRMIKNQESAARSRARKQAYTVELELELNQLREENERLKRLLEENEKKRKQEVLRVKQLASAHKKIEKLKTTRRTFSSGW